MNFYKLIIVLAFFISTSSPLHAAEEKLKSPVYVNASTIVLDLKNGKPVKIDNAQITGALDFSEAITGTHLRTINSPVSIVNSTFEDSVVGMTTFSNLLQLAHNSFEGGVNFRSCKFEESVDFNGSTFNNGAVFSNAEFKKKAIFSKARFRETAHFNSISAASTVDFTGTEFRKDADFKAAKLNMGLMFSKTLVRQRADFASAQLGIAATGLNDFEAAMIEGGISFSSTRINTETRIINCQLRTRLDLRDIFIAPTAKINWAGTRFGQLILLSHTTDLINLGIDREEWVAHLKKRINLVKENNYNFSFKEEELASFKVLRENPATSDEVRYLTRVFETEVQGGVYRIFKIVFLDWTFGYLYKPTRLLFWFVPLLAFVSVRYYYKRKTSGELINKEREDRYPTWASRISKEIVGESHVMLSFIPRRHREFVFNTYQHENADLELNYRDDSIYLTNYSTMRQFVRNWEQASMALHSNNIDQFKEASLALLELTTERLGLNVEKNPKYLSGKFGIMVYAPAIRLNVPAKFPFIFFQSQEFSNEDIKDTIELLKLLDTREQYFAINVVFNGRQKLMQVVHESIYRSDFVIIDKQTFWEILAKKSPIKILSGIILSQVDLLTVSPYVTGGPVSSKMFFGRIDEEKTLLQSIESNNFAIVANRKIGKTSLLNRIRDYLARDKNFEVYLFDLQPVNNYRKFFRSISRSSPEFAGLIAGIQDIEPIDIYEVIAGIKERIPGKRLVIIFDEVDDILEYDQQKKYELFKTLRELSQNNICRFIFIGSRTLVKSVQDPYSPFFNFCKSMRLGCLEEKYARELITGPMKEMGITFDEENRTVDKLISVSSCHPNILQYVCEQLLQLINEKSDRVITFEDADTVLSSREFYEYYTTVLWGQASAYEKLVVYTMMKNGAESFDENMVRIEFEKLGVSTAQLKDALQTLELYSLTRSENDHYRFTFKYLAEVTKQEEDVEFVIQELKEEAESV